ncbi:ribonuclease domain-containing protein [Corynebacterium callunae]|uniref:ribonuclease domain-containing protein n=1 Tax=Corynebacterium callunae TaxID=1721 RepID=UPI0039820330
MQNGKKALGGVLGLVVVLGAAWFGIDLTDSNTQTSSASSSLAATTSPSSTKKSTSATSAAQSTSRLDTCSLDELPEQADLVVDDILAGGPFDYPENDGVRFGNYEGVLPDEASSYYREYTVETPGLSHRGPLRIVTGGGSETDPEVWYYTSDHYETFCEITDAEN